MSLLFPRPSLRVRMRSRQPVQHLYSVMWRRFFDTSKQISYGDAACDARFSKQFSTGVKFEGRGSCSALQSIQRCPCGAALLRRRLRGLVGEEGSRLDATSCASSRRVHAAAGAVVHRAVRGRVRRVHDGRGASGGGPSASNWRLVSSRCAARRAICERISGYLRRNWRKSRWLSLANVL